MESLKHIESFVELNGKTVTYFDAFSLLQSLKIDIGSGKITKANDPYTAEIGSIQKALVKISNQLSGSSDDKAIIKIAPEKIVRLKKILKSQGLSGGVMALAASSAIGKVVEHTLWKLWAGKEYTQHEAALLGIIQDGLGFVEKDIYKVINKKILHYIETKKELPWRKPWRDGYKIKGATYGPQNYVTGDPYRGANAFMIALTNMIREKKSFLFLTLKQIQERGGSLRKYAEPVTVWAFIKGVKKQESKAGKEIKIPYTGIVTYNVYAMEDTINVKPIKHRAENAVSPDEVITDAETIIGGMPKRPAIKNDGGDRAFYRPITDSVHMPLKSKFKKVQQYYSTLFHELIHSTGHPKRLNRDISGAFGSKKYSFEELIAEIGAAYLCGVTDMDYYTAKNSAAYIKNWASNLKSEIAKDKTFLFRTVLAATRASKYIIANTLLKKGEVKEGPGTYPGQAKPSMLQSKSTGKDYYILQHTGETWAYAKVKASSIAIKGFADFVFFVRKEGKEYVISEASIGAKIAAGKTKADAQKMALQILELHGKEKLKANIAINTRLYGQSPRYSGSLSGISKIKTGNQRELFGLEGIAPRAQSKTTMTADKMQKLEYEVLPLNPYYRKIFGKVATNFDGTFTGEPGAGKSVFLLKFAQYMAENYKPILYVTPEEYGSATIIDKARRFKINSRNLTFSKSLYSGDYDLADFGGIIIDSVNSGKVSLAMYKEFREKYPNVFCIPILQTTKDGGYRGGKDWPHETEINLRLYKDPDTEDRMIEVSKDRYGEPRTVKI